MRCVLQRVSKAALYIEGTKHSAVSHGLCVFLGIAPDDNTACADFLLQKIVQLRIFEDENGKMNHSLQETGGELLIVSQFTLYADCSHGRRPAFTKAAKPDTAVPMYDYFVNQAKKHLGQHRVQTGVFGADMQISLVNEGPVTILLDTKDNMRQTTNH